MLNIENITKLRDYLLTIKDTHTLDMETYISWLIPLDALDDHYNCHTPCCAIGHAYSKGIGLTPNKDKYTRLDAFGDTHVDFVGYSIEKLVDREYIETEATDFSIWEFLFGDSWSDSFDEEIARLNIAIDGDWGKVKFHDNWLDTKATYA